MLKLEQIKDWKECVNRVVCGDCIEGMKILPDNSVDLIITSPPYNMRTRIRNGKYTEREKAEHQSKKYRYFHDALPIEDYYSFHKKALEEMMRISPLVFWNIQIVTGSKEAVFKLIGHFNEYLKDIIIWDKGFGEPAMHESVLNRSYEMILIFESKKSPGRAFKKCNFKKGEMPDIFRIKNRGSNLKEHGACFSEDLVWKIVDGWSGGGN